MTERRGIPASSFFVGRGINAAAERQAIPVVKPPVTVNYGGSWSPSQHVAVQP